MEKKRNLWVIPTDKPTRLHNTFNVIRLEKGYDLSPNNQNIYITNDEEIKEGDWCLHLGMSYIDKIKSDKISLVKITDKQLCGKNGSHGYFWKQWDKNPSFSYHHSGLIKIILTTDQDLIKEGIQAIDDEFLEWFVKNPTCEEVEISSEILYEHKDTYRPYPSECKNLTKTKVNYYLSIIPKEQHLIDMENHENSLWEEPKKETLEEAAHKMLIDFGIISMSQLINILMVKKIMILFAKEQQERSYSDMRESFLQGWRIKERFEDLSPDIIYPNGLDYEEKQDYAFDLWFEQFKKK